MKKPASSEKKKTGQPRTGKAGKATAAGTAKTLTPSPGRQQVPTGLLEEHFPDSEAHAVRFEYYNPSASEVLVAGSFNDWQPRATPLSKQRGGNWSAVLLLKPGHYEYRFVVDGQWQDDPMAARFVANAFGGLNCVVEVKPMAAPPASRP
jgi:1,4-alpha-glucan branching enzyme